MSLDVSLEKKCTCGESSESVFDWNITHNLTGMAERAGLYGYLWRPEEQGIKKAKQLIEPLEKGLMRLKGDPEKYKELNPKNGWGNYEGLLNFVEEYLVASNKYPEATIEVSR